MTYDVGNPGPGIRQAHKCGKVKLVKGIPTPTVLITGFPLAIQINVNMHGFTSTPFSEVHLR
jgi:hypothetical protein